jgi:hypothetical protein
MNPRRSPERIRSGHSPNQPADLASRGWATATGAALPRPEQAEPASVPSEHHVRLDEDESRPPIAPCLGQPRPERPVGRGQSDPRGARTIQDCHLMSERHDLQVQRGA